MSDASDEIAAAIRRARSRVTATSAPVKFGTRSRWYTVAFMLGVSYRTLARLEGVSPQAIEAAVFRQNPSKIRLDVGRKISLEEVAVLKSMWDERPDEWASMDSGAVAEKFLERLNDMGVED